MFFSEEILATFVPKFAPRIYKYTGGFQTFRVPYGVRRIKVAAAGVKGTASGLTLRGGGGNGGLVECTLKTTPGQILYIWVGQYIASAGYTYSPIYNASDIRTNNAGATDKTSLESRIIVAGAGGNGGGTYSAYTAGSGGAGGGLIGGNGTDPGSGYGGTQERGGSGGVGEQTVGGAGGFGLGGGGNGSVQSGIIPGAGGAGWYGGGGGGGKTHNSPYNVGGGGGGSSYTDQNLCTDVVHTQGAVQGEGYIKIWAVGDEEPDMD